MLNNKYKHAQRELIAPYLLTRENPNGDGISTNQKYLVKDIDPIRSLLHAYSV